MSRPTPPRDAGSVSVAASMLVVVALGAAALVFDGAQLLIAERHASNAAEGAARAALATATPGEPLDHRRAQAAAVRHAEATGVSPADVVVAFPSARSVVVTVTERRRAAFGLLDDHDVTMSGSASGRAVLTYTGRP